jgi:hypothetical protein
MAALTENPAFAASKTLQNEADPIRADLEAAVASLKAPGNEPQSVEAMETMMRAREAALQAKFDAKLEQLEAKLAANGAPLSSAVRSVVAHLSQAPPNWHQATVMFFGGDADADVAVAFWRAWSLMISVLMVFGQSMVAVGVFIGTELPACSSSDQCGQKGTYCDDRNDGAGACTFCGSAAPLPEQTDPRTGGTLNYAQAPDYAGFNLTLVAEVCADTTGGPETVSIHGLPVSRALTSWCEACVHAVDGQVDDLTTERLAQANVAAMGVFDWIALVLATVVVALTIGGELKV